MRYYRSERVGKLIREETSKLIARELEFGNALPTITEVEVDRKLEHAAVRVTVWPTEEAPKVLKLLRASQGRLQHLLFTTINIRPMPRIQFELDRGPENAATVEKLLFEDDNG